MARTKTAPISATRTQARRQGWAESPEKVPIQSGFGVVCRVRRYSSARRRAFLPPRPAFTSKYVLRPIPILAPLFLMGDHRGITGRIQTRAQIRRHPCLGNYWQPDHPFFRFVVE